MSDKKIIIRNCPAYSETQGVYWTCYEDNNKLLCQECTDCVMKRIVGLCKKAIKDCEKWYGKEIHILQSKYKNVMDVIERIKFINSPHGASCTIRLKTRVRQEFEYEHPEITDYIWGFEKGSREEKRAERMCERYPEYNHLFPLIEANLNKASCLNLLEKQGIEIPMMYKLGYHNNNCIGCVKGGMGYWNKIRKDFPDVFDKMAKLERKIGARCLKQYYLDELPEDAGRDEGVIIPSCSIFCGFINLDTESEG